jgi:ABC-2 type transport system permease protein
VKVRVLEGRASAVAVREAKGCFASPVGWTIAAVFFLVAGIIFVGLLIRYRQAGISLAQSGEARAPGGLHVNDWVVRPYLYNLGSVLLFFIPILTMRSIAEERRLGSLELLLSSPLRGSDLILGKFLGASLSLASLLLIVPIQGLILAGITTPDWGAASVGVLGLVLLGLFMVGLGILISSVSQSQVEAGVLTLGLLLLLGLGQGVAEAASPALARLFSFVAILDRFENFTRGVLDLRDVAFFAGGILVMLALSLRSLDLLRWRGV